MLLDTGKTLVYGPVDYKDHQIRLYCIVEISATNATFKSSESTLTVHCESTRYIYLTLLAWIGFTHRLYATM